jgi:hypothetical protein
MTKHIFICLLMTSTNVLAQTTTLKPNDTVAINKCIQHYFTAADNSNPEELGNAFDPGAMMFWVDSTGRIDYVTQNACKSRMKQVAKPIKAKKREILNLDITNDICIAKVRSTFDDRVYLDYLALIKNNLQWKIINKTFVRHSPNELPVFDSLKETNAIRSLIETKFKSMDNNDADLLASAYYPRAMSYYVDHGAVVAVSIAEWIARFDNDKRKGNDKNTKAIRAIQKIDVFKEIGYVSFTHSFANAVVVTDKVLVLKIDNRWRIINLLFTNEN